MISQRDLEKVVELAKERRAALATEEQAEALDRVMKLMEGDVFPTWLEVGRTLTWEDGVESEVEEIWVDEDAQVQVRLLETHPSKGTEKVSVTLDDIVSKWEKDGLAMD